MNDRRSNGCVVSVGHAALREEGAQLGARVELGHRIAAVSIALPVVQSGNVVQVDGRPETRRLLCPAGGCEQPEGMHHHAGDVRLPMERARVREQVWWRNQAAQWKHDGRKQSTQERVP